MDSRHEPGPDDPVVVTGLGRADANADARSYLKVRKMRKYMGVQDALAVVAAGEALRAAGLEAPLGERAGLYLAVGFIPFVAEDIDLLLEGSITDEGAFSMPQFTRVGYRAVNPLLTFRCLSNMPAFHVSVNFDIQGPYSTGYPGAGQLYAALEDACLALEEGAIDVALVGGVAHQRNFLVEHHFARLDPPVPAERLRDGAGVLVLERASSAAARGASVRATLEEWALAYEPHHPFEQHLQPGERFEGLDDPPHVEALGPAGLPVGLSRAVEAQGAALEHHLETRDGLRARSRWRLS
jgi:3-oxoacyl-(acyl-carrier-protein) synthase